MGIGTQIDLGKLIHWYELAAKSGDAETQFELGMMYWAGNEILPDKAKARTLLQASADNGLDVGAYQFALYLTELEEDPLLITSYFIKSAQADYIPGLFQAGKRIRHGIGADIDLTQASLFLGKAAIAGHVEAQYEYGDMIRKGDGVKQDPKGAVKYLQLAANSGNGPAMAAYANMLENGEGVITDFKNAAIWYEKALNSGVTNAAHNLALMYETGRGVEQDYKMAFGLYKQAAEIGILQAQVNLGILYARGLASTQDFERAHMWFNIAAANGHQSALKFRERISTKMSRNAISDAQKMAKICVEKALRGC